MSFSLSESSSNDCFHIFTDGSVNTRSGVGYGACLMISDLSVTVESLKKSVKLKRFEHTSSTKLELQTLLWALNENFVSVNGSNSTLTIYTDSQNIIGLPGRRERLEKNNYYSSKNRRLNNYELYREFYRLSSELKCELVKVVGHQAASKKDKIHTLFGLVDQTARRELRKDI